MEPTHFLRAVRRRWKLLLALVVLGGCLGYATTLLESDDPDAPVVRYYAAGVQLVPARGVVLDGTLEEIAPTVTGAEVRNIVADEMDIEPTDVQPRIRVLFDERQRLLEIHTIGEDIEETVRMASVVADAFNAVLNAADVESYEESLARLDAQIAGYDADIFRLSGTIEGLENRIAFGEDLPAEDDALLRQSQAEFDTVVALGTTARDERERLEEQGPPDAPFEQLNPLGPLTISEREFGRRVAEAQQLRNVLSADEAGLADTSQPTVSERLKSPIARGVLGALAAAMIGLLLLSMYLRLDPKLRTKDDMELAFGLPVLGEIPVLPKKERTRQLLHAKDQPRSRVTEAYRSVRSALLFAKAVTNTADAQGNGQDHLQLELEVEDGKDAKKGVPNPREREVRVLMVTSPGAGEGKTTTAVNLAVLLAEAGYDTVLMNCDYRLPTAHEYFHVDYRPAQSLDTDIPNVHVIPEVIDPTGLQPARILAEQRRIIERARQVADVVVLDTAPILATNDAVDLLPVTDLVLLVAREGRTTKDAAAETAELLVERMGVPVAGVVAIGTGGNAGGRYYRKYRYGAYYDKHKTAPKTAQAQRADAKAAKPSKKKAKKGEADEVAESGVARPEPVPMPPPMGEAPVKRNGTSVDPDPAVSASLSDDAVFPTEVPEGFEAPVVDEEVEVIDLESTLDDDENRRYF